MNLKTAKSRAIAQTKESGIAHVVYEYEEYPEDYGVTSLKSWNDASVINENPEFWEGCVEIETIEPQPVPDEELAKLIADAITAQLIINWGWESNCPVIYFPDGSEWGVGSMEELRLCIKSVTKGADVAIEQWMHCEVLLDSDEYGGEVFKYPNLSEALKGFNNIKEGCRNCFDQIKRTLRLVMVSEELNPED